MANIVKPSSLGSASPARKVVVRRPSMRQPAVRLRDLNEGQPGLQPRARVVPASDLRRMPLISYERFRAHMLKLNPGLIFERIEGGGLHGGKVRIGVPFRPKHEIEEYEGLTWWEKRQVELLRAEEGPSRCWTPISPGFIHPFVTLLTRRSHYAPQQVIARSLKRALGRLVGGGAFTWEAAEREFGIAFRSHPTIEREVEDVEPAPWLGKQEQAANQVVLSGG